MLNTGFQYTPVASMAVCSHPAACNHVTSAVRPSVVVANVRTCLRRPVAASACSRQATTVSRCTSSPQQHQYCLSTRASFREPRTALERSCAGAGAAVSRYWSSWSAREGCHR